MWIKQYWMMPKTLHQAGLKSFQDVMQIQGKVFRSVVGRKTIQVNVGDKSYFIKQHFGVGWGEIFKNLLSLKMPIIGAMTEVKAIQKLDEIGIATTPLLAYGQQGYSPASMRSFVITEDLGDIISLEDLCADWAKNPPEAQFKQKLIIAMALLAAKLHGAGLCHRDFYLCHMVLKKQGLVDENLSLHIIDLHRVLQGQPLNGSAVMKDIAGLVFSTKDCGFTAEDWTLFKQHYLPKSQSFWLQAEARAQQLYTKFHSDKFQKRLTSEKSAVD
jgi:Lipopolysaccharide kinase (Kdo/WaaP) family